MPTMYVQCVRPFTSLRTFQRRGQWWHRSGRGTKWPFVASTLLGCPSLGEVDNFTRPLVGWLITIRLAHNYPLRLELLIGNNPEVRQFWKSIMDTVVWQNTKGCFLHLNGVPFGKREKRRKMVVVMSFLHTAYFLESILFFFWQQLKMLNYKSLESELLCNACQESKTWLTPIKFTVHISFVVLSSKRLIANVYAQTSLQHFQSSSSTNNSWPESWLSATSLWFSTVSSLFFKRLHDLAGSAYNTITAIMNATDWEN